MGEELEYLDIGESTDAILSRSTRFDYPVVSFVKGGGFSFNKYATTLFSKTKYVEIRANANYVVFIPTERKSKGAYSIVTYNGFCYMAVPAELKSRGFKCGAYKIYKCKGGFCIKRNEPLETA